jgi:AraC-like DNA-binding protein
MIAEQHRWTSGSSAIPHAFSDWVEEAREHIGDIEFGPVDKSDFYARFVQRRIGPIELTAIQASQSKAERRVSGKRIAPMRYDLKYIREGIFRIEQNGQVVEAGSGEFVLVDNNCDFRFETSSKIDCICVSASEAWLGTKLLDPAACVLQPIDKKSAWARALGLMLSELADLPPGDHALPAEVIAEQFAGFMMLMFQGLEVQTSSYKQKLIRSLVRSIQANHYDPEITPAGIASQHRISKRYLHALLATAGTTFGRELLQARIERARAMLEDERYRFTAVNEIAMKCGFIDPAHFTRRFRSLLGNTPSDYRAGAFA